METNAKTGMDEGFGESVKNILYERRLTHKWLAEQIGISKSYMSGILNDTRKAKAQKQKIMAVLNIM